jgi:aminoglycoside adenylyltransferase-like protein
MTAGDGVKTLLQDGRQAANRVGRALKDALGGELVAVYLHGSAVLGGFRWERSDLDILALSRLAMSDEELHSVVRALALLPYPANGLEFTLMTRHEASQPELPAPRFQLHQTTAGWDRAGKVVDGREREGDPDLVLHLAVCREHGQRIAGPEPRMALGAVPSQAIESAMSSEIGWARAHASLSYLVLTAARAWFFAETHQMVSKIDAGEWAAERYAQPAVIQAALDAQSGVAAAIPMRAAEPFAEYVERLMGR